MTSEPGETGSGNTDPSSTPSRSINSGSTETSSAKPVAAVERPDESPAPPNGDDRATFGPPAPRRRRVIEAVKLRRRDLAATLGAGIAGDVALRHLPGGNLAATIFVITLVVGLVAAGRASTPFVRRCLAGAMFFGAMLSFRSDPRLVAFNTLAALFLIVLGATPPARFFDTRPIQAMRNAWEAAAAALGFVAQLPGQTEAQYRQRIGTRSSPQAVATVRGVALALPIVGLLGLLLASADAVFASFFAATLGSFASGLGHLLLLPFGALTMGLLIRLRSANTNPVEQPRAPRIAKTETLVVLGLLDALFVLFAIAQLVARSDFGDTVLLDNGLTYKDHARHGFFQLLWVAGITMAVLLSLRSTTLAWSRDSRAFISLSLTAVALTLAIVGIAFARLQLYVGDNGLTPLRFYSSVFSLWIGFGFALVAARLVGFQREHAWMLPALLVSSLVTLAGLDLANPEAIIATNNLERNERALLWHVDKFSGDGIGVIIAGIDDLDAALALELTDQLCSESFDRQRTDRQGKNSNAGLLEWNWGTANGRNALVDLCPLAS